MTSIHRRNFLKQTGAVAALAALGPSHASAEIRPILTSSEEIEKRVRAARPLMGGMIPADLKDRLGATHYDGHYHLTEEPFLIEGAEAIHRLGMNVAKFWLREDELPGYGYHSDWSQVLKSGRLVDVLKHKDYVEALALPFRTVFLEVFPLVGNKQTFFSGKNTFADEEEQFHEVASYLIKTYADRDITFIIQHWEGDWMLRREEGGTWGQVPPAEVDRRCDAFIHWLSARQRGVDKARKESGVSKCKVYHAAEVNRVWDSTKGLPTLTNRVLPHVALDLVSWSSYDGMKTATETWQGIELIRQHMRPSPTFGKNAVFVGEIGKPENEAKEADIIEWWDRAMGVMLAMDIPWIVHWELYCNEPKDGTKSDRRPRKAEEMRGFWLLRPDGSLSHSGRYLTTLLQNAGKSLPEDVRKSFAP
jgi:TAT (twin-arginine translocation) pathway signal sequence